MTKNTQGVDFFVSALLFFSPLVHLYKNKEIIFAAPKTNNNSKYTVK